MPDLDSKFYAATQTMDEARHVETFTKLLDQVGVTYPINPQLQELLNQTLRDSRWDMAYLGMQVLIEGLALAAFGTLRELCQTQLPKQVLAFVMQDEARHVAFGRLALKDAYADLTAAERADREEFVVEACYLMRDRLRQREMWEALDYDVADCMEYAENSPAWQFYRNNLFTRIVPCIRDIGLWGDTVQKAYADMGVLDYAGADIEGLMAQDEVDRRIAGHPAGRRGPGGRGARRRSRSASASEPPLSQPPLTGPLTVRASGRDGERRLARAAAALRPLSRVASRREQTSTADLSRSRVCSIPARLCAARSPTPVTRSATGLKMRLRWSVQLSVTRHPVAVVSQLVTPLGDRAGPAP